MSITGTGTMSLPVRRANAAVEVFTVILGIPRRVDSAVDLSYLSEARLVNVLARPLLNIFGGTALKAHTARRNPSLMFPDMTQTSWISNCMVIRIRMAALRVWRMCAHAVMDDILWAIQGTTIIITITIIYRLTMAGIINNWSSSSSNNNTSLGQFLLQRGLSALVLGAPTHTMAVGVCSRGDVQMVRSFGLAREDPRRRRRRRLASE